MTREPGSPAQKSGKDNGEDSSTIIARINVRGTIIAASITAFAGLVGILIPVIVGTTGGARPPVVPTPEAQSVLAPSHTGSPTLSSSPPTSPSPDQDPGSIATVPPSAFNDAQTDPTQINVDTMLPQKYSDADADFHRTSGSVQPCPMRNEATDVANSLHSYGCTSAVVGTYLDSAAQMQVTVWVIPMPDATAADGAFNDSRLNVVDDWGIWCPGTGVGSQICQGSWRSAMIYARTGSCHRYLMHAEALYVDLRSRDPASLPELTLAATAANRSIGVHYIPAAQC